MYKQKPTSGSLMKEHDLYKSRPILCSIHFEMIDAPILRNFVGMFSTNKKYHIYEIKDCCRCCHDYCRRN
uniref:THAP-type domain-containing protein n=1 Tax=Romanomermis culicivorax TaxID=13658 RepID=A0A915J6P3_ROMCU